MARIERVLSTPAGHDEPTQFSGAYLVWTPLSAPWSGPQRVPKR